MALTEIKKDELCFALYALSDQLFYGFGFVLRNLIQYSHEKYIVI